MDCWLLSGLFVDVAKIYSIKIVDRNINSATTAVASVNLAVKEGK